MNYESKNIRNIMLAGHAGSGKTTLAEALLYSTGALERMGRVEDGTTVSDFDPEEARRLASLNLAVVPVESEGYKFNLIDTPGLFDFELGQSEGIMAAESVLICVSGRSGVTVGAEKAYHLAVKNGKARMVFVGKMDLENANFSKILTDLKVKLGPTVCPCVVPARLDDGTQVYINLFSQKAFKYESGKQVQVDVPDIGHTYAGMIEAMSEAIAETDDALMEKFFGGEPFTTEEIVEGMRNGVNSGKITPVFCGSAVNQQALDMLLYNMRVLLPSPVYAGNVLAANKAGEPVELEPDCTKPLVARVFKTVADPFVGKLSYVKVISGTLTGTSAIVNGRTGEADKMGKLMFVSGKKQSDAAKVIAGDICAVSKLTARTGDTLCDPSCVVQLPEPSFPHACYSMAVKVAKKGDEGKISSGLTRLVEEDLTLKFSQNPETAEQILAGLGEQHLEVAVCKLKSKFGVEVDLSDPKVAYRETIRKKVTMIEGNHKKQSGGHGQYGNVKMNFEPIPGDGFEFAEEVFGGSVPKNFHPAVEKGIREAMEHGVLAGFPMVGLKATLMDGKYHDVDSNELSFKMAARLAYKAGIPQANPVVLEPVGSLKVTIPDSFMGDIIGDLNKRRGRVMGMNPAEEEGLQLVEAEVPMSEVADYAITLRSMTQGRGSFTVKFERYEEVPRDVQDKIIAEHKVEVEEE